MAEPCGVVLVPCGHVMCAGCARAMRSCPFDRGEIASLMRYFPPR
jgi:hypothetical protein